MRWDLKEQWAQNRKKRIQELEMRDLQYGRLICRFFSTTQKITAERYYRKNDRATASLVGLVVWRSFCGQ